MRTVVQRPAQRHKHCSQPSLRGADFALNGHTGRRGVQRVTSTLGDCFAAMQFERKRVHLPRRGRPARAITPKKRHDRPDPLFVVRRAHNVRRHPLRIRTRGSFHALPTAGTAGGCQYAGPQQQQRRPRQLPDRSSCFAPISASAWPSAFSSARTPRSACIQPLRLIHELGVTYLDIGQSHGGHLGF